MYQVVIIRHGQSEWNSKNIFTGWTDVGLSEQGIEEAKQSGIKLREKGFSFDLAFTSYLKRAKDTLSIVLEQLSLDVPVSYSWRLNERHYGALQGMNKDEIKHKYGEEQFVKWRRGYSDCPPAVEKEDSRYPGHDPMYAELSEEELPLTESLEKTEKRVLPYWENEIIPQIKVGKKVIISAHGNSIRALIRIIDNLTPEEIEKTEVPTGKPLIYEFDENMNPVIKYYLD
ncbi:MAG: 2,3-diphosphoglycerate-dependent phosphoglycerate mutase [Minisyncoccus archaeiphilus]|uniref:2,3-diphosphoglycerate-dependent phosphoglycerate mutase n=1 Tax=Minisyncoccus archaeiphilus TaxID=3238481 RepID=UPI002B07132B|nr:MAG: 2,3-diphosphoglycerate-dependent phosphoglycerate mutase [Candidatus Parcubacteria bacterium]